MNPQPSPQAFEEGGDLAGVAMLMGFLASLWVKLSMEVSRAEGGASVGACSCGIFGEGRYEKRHPQPAAPNGRLDGAHPDTAHTAHTDRPFSHPATPHTRNHTARTPSRRRSWGTGVPHPWHTRSRDARF